MAIITKPKKEYSVPYSAYPAAIRSVPYNAISYPGARSAEDPEARCATALEARAANPAIACAAYPATRVPCNRKSNKRYFKPYKKRVENRPRYNTKLK